MYSLDGHQKKTLHAALCHAFPRTPALERLVEFHLDEHLAVIVGEGALDDVIFRLIAWAESQGRLAALINGARAEAPGNPLLTDFERTVIEARDARPQDATLRRFAEGVQLAPAVPDETDLEKRVFRAGFSDIAQWRARLGQAELAVCRIEAPAWRALGTGFLVGPDLVMTNRHVVDAFATQPAPPLLVRFDFKLSPDGSHLREGETFAIARDWLVASSPVDQLDFAVLRLAAPAGLAPTGGTASAPPRGWVTPHWRELESDETIFVIQHPQGDTLKLASGRYDSRDATRLRYRVDTEPGSSGSPCFTAQMELVALHRGSAEGAANQGIPFDAIAAALPPAFFPVPHVAQSDARVATPAVVTHEAIAAVVTQEGLVPPKRGRPARLVAAGLLAAGALVAVPFWWTSADTAVAPKTRSRVPAATATGTTPSPGARAPVRVVSVRYRAERLLAAECQSDTSFQRALFKLESTETWPAPAGPRGREVQLVALSGLEIEHASIAMAGGAEAAAVSQPQRLVARKWLFAEPVTAPIVILACVRSRSASPLLPTLHITTWKEVAP